MGITVKRLIFKEHRKSEKSVELDFLIDSGAVYSLVPGKVLDELEIETYKTIDFSLADRTKITKRVASGYLNIMVKAVPHPLFMEKRVMNRCWE